MVKAPILTHPILERWGALRKRLDEAARRAGRAPESVDVVAVVKYAALEDVQALVGSGLARWYGESRVQDAGRRREALGGAERAAWRFIGHLQTNKAKAALELFDHFDAVDSAALAEALERRLEGTDRRVGVMVQVKLTGRETQSGVAPEDAAGLVARLRALPHLRPEGLMGIAPQGSGPEDARPGFRRLKGLFDELFGEDEGARLSMGMSGDCEVAVEEGATLVRVGSDLFGPGLRSRDGRLDQSEKGGSE
ncbi:MAG: YggS family pyridoxal phosphate-dependent enzyme [Elusimicrobia bacterium]|nr:YggS family pyridoxal phosphate-dependent enzyme [Elusimicrobiota bacterium]